MLRMHMARREAQQPPGLPAPTHTSGIVRACCDAMHPFAAHTYQRQGESGCFSACGVLVGCASVWGHNLHWQLLQGLIAGAAMALMAVEQLHDMFPACNLCDSL
jgi:hypothetical protein